MRSRSLPSKIVKTFPVLTKCVHFISAKHMHVIMEICINIIIITFYVATFGLSPSQRPTDSLPRRRGNPWPTLDMLFVIPTTFTLLLQAIDPDSFCYKTCSNPEGNHNKLVFYIECLVFDVVFMFVIYLIWNFITSMDISCSVVEYISL